MCFFGVICDDGVVMTGDRFCDVRDGQLTMIREGRGGRTKETLVGMEEQNEEGFDLGNEGHVRGG